MERLKGVPKIIWSTSASDHFKKACMEAGADDYIIKPSNMAELTDIIRHLVSFCSA
jgi:DNA-binding response OmpR family regulator